MTCMEALSKYGDFIFFGLVCLINLGAQWEQQKLLGSQRDPAHNERELGATTLSTASGAVITGVSILVAASMLIIQTAVEHKEKVPTPVLDHVLRACLWLFISLGCGLYVMCMVPMLSHKHNVAKRLHILLVFIPQLFSLFIGMWWLYAGASALVEHLDVTP